VWEIPIVVALLIISPIASITISLLNTSVLLVFFPGPLPISPIYNLLATLSMQIGIYLIVTIGKKLYYHKTSQTNIRTRLKWLAAIIALGILTRVAFMSAILYFALPQEPPIGYGLDQTLTNAYLFPTAIFNGTLALYTIFIGWIIALRVQKVLHITLQK
jgi:hypothetical protein